MPATEPGKLSPEGVEEAAAVAGEPADSAMAVRLDAEAATMAAFRPHVN
jgi:hypothetical protein